MDSYQTYLQNSTASMPPNLADEERPEPLLELPPYLTGEPLTAALTMLPPYDASIRRADVGARMTALAALYEIYIPTVMSVEIYNKLFFAVRGSLMKKKSPQVIRQGYLNRRVSAGGVIGGSDSFSIIGSSGIGKSAAIGRAVSLIGGDQIYTMTNPYRLFLPAVVVQTPFDASPKGMLLGILQTVDERLGTHYYENALRTRATQDMLIGTVSQVCLNHIGVLIVDEIQNVIENRNGRNLVGLLTQMINASGVGICFVGTPEASAFFEQTPYLARRTIGLYYGPMEYNDEFCRICGTVLDYCYTSRGISNKETLLGAAHEYSGGTVSTVVALLHDAQEIAILSGREILDRQSLDLAWRNRMGTMHGGLCLQNKVTSLPRRKTRLDMPDAVRLPTENMQRNTAAAGTSAENEFTTQGCSTAGKEQVSQTDMLPADEDAGGNRWPVTRNVDSEVRPMLRTVLEQTGVCDGETDLVDTLRGHGLLERQVSLS